MPNLHPQLLPAQALVVAVEQVVVVVVEVHTIALTEFPHLAILTLAFASPLAVAERLEAVLPHLPDVVFIDIALVETRTDTRTARNCTIDLDTHDADARLTAKEIIPHLCLVATEEALAGVVTLDAPLLASVGNKVHQSTVLL